MSSLPHPDPLPSFFLTASVILSYFSEVPQTGKQIKLQDVGFPLWNDHPSCPLIYVVKGRRGGRGRKKCMQGHKGSLHAVGKITKAVAGVWLWCGGLLTHMATIFCPWVATVECCSPENPGLLPHDTKIAAVDAPPLHLRTAAALQSLVQSCKQPELTQPATLGVKCI